MPFEPDRHHRRSIRLPAHDYGGGGSYFITICVDGRRCLFGDVQEGNVALSPLGRIAEEEWERSASMRPTIRLDAVVVMPNHVHGLVTMVEAAVVAHSIASPEGALLRALTSGYPRRGPRTVGSFVGAYKGAVTRRINAMRDVTGQTVWQRNYYEHVVRDEDDYYRIVAYIEENARRWEDDEYHPKRL